MDALGLATVAGSGGLGKVIRSTSRHDCNSAGDCGNSMESDMSCHASFAPDHWFEFDWFPELRCWKDLDF